MTAEIPSAALANFQRLLAAGKESALLRYAIGNELVKLGDAHAAIEHLERAIGLDPQYTAAWKLYAKALAGDGRTADAVRAYGQGIAVAQAKGDKQAEKEMRVFVRRLERSAPGERPDADSEPP